MNGGPCLEKMAYCIKALFKPPRSRDGRRCRVKVYAMNVSRVKRSGLAMSLQTYVLHSTDGFTRSPFVYVAKSYIFLRFNAWTLSRRIRVV